MDDAAFHGEGSEIKRRVVGKGLVADKCHEQNNTCGNGCRQKCLEGESEGVFNGIRAVAYEDREACIDCDEDCAQENCYVFYESGRIDAKDIVGIFGRGWLTVDAKDE